VRPSIGDEQLGGGWDVTGHGWHLDDTAYSGHNFPGVDRERVHDIVVAKTILKFICQSADFWHSAAQIAQLNSCAERLGRNLRMPAVKKLPVSDLILDLSNFRHMEQKTEVKALHAMSTLKPDYFWSLANSLLENGYVEVENVVVFKNSDGYHVKEGNRRVAIMKLALGLLKPKDLDLPAKTTELLAKVDDDWRELNKSVPCLIFNSGEEAGADRVVDLTHGKGEKEGRLDWNAVATARHNIARGGYEQSLVLLEKYLKHASNMTGDEKEHWQAEYPLTILHNAMNVLDTRLGVKTGREVAELYPKLPKHRAGLDSIVLDIGREKIRTDDVRSSDFGVSYGIPLLPTPTPPTPGAPGSPGTPSGPPTGGGSPPPTPPSTPPAAPPSKPLAVPNDTQVGVRRMLRGLVLRGNRGKLSSLRNEALKLKLEDNPLCFCFLMRSMLELSAKAYCDDHAGKSGAPTATKASGEDRQLLDVLRDIYSHLTFDPANPAKPDKAKVRALHGAMQELGDADGPFSITSLNQLIHHKTFALTEKHICTVFTNVFPMLAAMNK
jgi:hypothetical protein